MNMLKRILLTALAVSLMVAGYISPTQAQQTFSFPTVYKSATDTVSWTGGTVNNGGHPVTIAAGGTLTPTLNKTDCTSPGYASCYFVYANSAGTVAGSATATTAFASGNILLGMIETGASDVTQIVFPTQTSDPYNSGLLMTNCGTSTSCATPTQIYSKAMKFASGQTALASASPSTVTITGIPAFTSTSTMFCSASPIGTTAAIAAGGIAVSLTSSSSITLTGPNTVTTAVGWQCWGW